MSEKKPLAEAVKGLADAARRQSDGPPTFEELIAYLDGELSPEAEERLRNSLALHHESRRDLLALVALSRIEPQPIEGEAPAHVPSWEDMAARLDGVSPPAAVERRGRGMRWLGLVAAGLLLLVGGMWLRPWVWPGGVESTADVLVHVATLESLEQRSSLDWSAVRVQPGDTHIGLSLGPGDPGDHAEYRVEILRPGPGEAVLWSRDGYQPGVLGTFDVIFDRRALDVGRYRVRLLGSSGEGFAEVARFHIELILD